MPSPSEVTQFQRLIAQLSGAALAAVRALWASTQDWGELQEAYPDLVDPYLAGAAQMAAEWYASLAPDVDFPVETPELTPLEALRASVRWALTQPEQLTALTGSTERRVFNASRDTVLHNVEREGVAYARHASANACGFCRVMATRGDVYSSEESATRVVGRGKPIGTNFNPDGTKKVGGQAKGVKTRGKRKLGEKWHDNCHCIAVPVREGDFYTPPDYVNQWKNDYKAAFDAVPDGTPYDDGQVLNMVVNHMRRNTDAR